MKRGSTFILFGGTGFIGTHLGQHLLANDPDCRIVLVDVNPPRRAPYAQSLQEALATGRARYVQMDVRRPIATEVLPQAPTVVFNLAAVHREPGHHCDEYFETNLLGAENVCRYAAQSGCDYIVFTSSISPYGPSDESKDENSLPTPQTAYGSSKLAAEKIHLGWQQARPQRKLLIVRPGVVFGPGEGGNVTRLVRSLVRGYFVYMGNREVKKAGGYVKELCRVIGFLMEQQESSGDGYLVANFSMEPTPALREYVGAISRVTGIRRSPVTIPRVAIMAVSHAAHTAASVIGRQTQLNPTRVRKLFRSTYVRPTKLVELGYRWKFSLEDAFADWKRESAADFER